MNDSSFHSRFPKPPAARRLGFGVAIACLALAALIWGSDSAFAQSAKPPAPPPPAPGQELMNPGDEVDGNAIDQPGGTTVPGVGIPGRSAGKGKGKGQAPAGPVTPACWAVVLATFSDEGHKEMAKAARDRLAEAYPALKDSFVRSTERGSVVMLGAFTTPKEEQARTTLEAVKAISPDGRNRPFSKAYLSRVPGTGGPVSAFELTAWARKKMPGVRPTFTVQVAMWGDFDSNTMTQDQVDAKAEAHCRSLRARGLDAFMHSDPDKHTAIVTVGIFDSSAYDARSTLFSPPVERLFKQFPAMLVNGEELLVPPPKGAPAGTPPTKQPCVLIEVPK